MTTSQNGGHGVLISVIDDDESVREGIAGLMTWAGFKVAAFSSAAEFLASPELQDSACIITDVQMPNMTGIELCDHLRALGHDIPTILVTAYPDEGARTRVLAAGALGYLSKPFDKDELIGHIRAALKP